MNRLVQSSVVLLILTMSATAQIQKSPNNRVYVDEDYEYTERARRTRGVNELMAKGLSAHNAGNYRVAATAYAASEFGLIDPKSALARYNLAMTCLALNQKDCAREQYAILKHVEPGLSTQLFDYMHSSKVLRLVK